MLADKSDWFFHTLFDAASELVHQGSLEESLLIEVIILLSLENYGGEPTPLCHKRHRTYNGSDQSQTAAAPPPKATETPPREQRANRRAVCRLHCGVRGRITHGSNGYLPYSCACPRRHHQPPSTLPMPRRATQHRGLRHPWLPRPQQGRQLQSAQQPGRP